MFYRHRSQLKAGFVLRPGLQSQEGNRSLGFYLSIYGNVHNIMFVWIPASLHSFKNNIITSSYSPSVLKSEGIGMDSVIASLSP